ncbi:MAG: hypothetical protein HRT89_15340, partial [Lentisphaeria bacterium]|nr:hypothetical protein [Lentisphaeria bacterium]NQZ69430.1 hypothetical protein [Lentisphaeria bacterium]
MNTKHVRSFISVIIFTMSVSLWSQNDFINTYGTEAEPIYDSRVLNNYFALEGIVLLFSDASTETAEVTIGDNSIIENTPNIIDAEINKLSDAIFSRDYYTLTIAETATVDTFVDPATYRRGWHGAKAILFNDHPTSLFGFPLI